MVNVFVIDNDGKFNMHKDYDCAKSEGYFKIVKVNNPNDLDEVIKNLGPANADNTSKCSKCCK